MNTTWASQIKEHNTIRSDDYRTRASMCEFNDGTHHNELVLHCSELDITESTITLSDSRCKSIIARDSEGNQVELTIFFDIAEPFWK